MIVAEWEPPLARFCHLRPVDVRDLRMSQFNNFVTYTAPLVVAEREAVTDGRIAP